MKREREVSKVSQKECRTFKYLALAMRGCGKSHLKRVRSHVEVAKQRKQSKVSNEKAKLRKEQDLRKRRVCRD